MSSRYARFVVLSRRSFAVYVSGVSRNFRENASKRCRGFDGTRAARTVRAVTIRRLTARARTSYRWARLVPRKQPVTSTAILLTFTSGHAPPGQPARTAHAGDPRR